VEFVDRDKAVAEAERAIGLLNASDEAKVEAWFALQAVADLVGSMSNTGVRGIYWAATGPNGRPAYRLQATCKHGRVATSTGAPPTLEQARSPEYLDRAVALLDKKIDERGGLLTQARPAGTGPALVDAVRATATGRDWADRNVNPAMRLLIMVKVADVYGRLGVFPSASVSAHYSFIGFEDRAKLVRAYPHAASAWAKARSLRQGLPQDEAPTPATICLPASQVATLAIRSGVTRREARTILRALLDGRTKAKLVRAINEAERMLNGDGS
jgi:hypothetical protein